MNVYHFLALDILLALMSGVLLQDPALVVPATRTAVWIRRGFSGALVLYAFTGAFIATRLWWIRYG